MYNTTLCHTDADRFGTEWPTTAADAVVLSTCPSPLYGQSSRLCCGLETLGSADTQGTVCTLSRLGSWLATDISACSALAPGTLAGAANPLELLVGLETDLTLSTTDLGDIVALVDSLNTTALNATAITSLIELLDGMLDSHDSGSMCSAATQSSTPNMAAVIEILTSALSTRTDINTTVLGLSNVEIMAAAAVALTSDFVWQSASSPARVKIPAAVLQAAAAANVSLGRISVSYIADPSLFPCARQPASAVISVTLPDVSSASLNNFPEPIELSLPRTLNNQLKQRLMATYETRKSVLADGSVTDVTLDTSDINARLIYNISEDAFSFRTETENVTLSCAWWSESTRSWRSDGCQLKSFNSSSIICECTHMTSFAVLVSNSGSASTADEESVSVIVFQHICLGILLCSLIVLALALVLVRVKATLRLPETILLHIVVASLGTYLTFGTAIERGDTSEASCVVRSGILHYFLLALLLLLVAEGSHLWLAFVKVLPGNISMNGMVNILLTVAWVLPLPIVGVSIAVHRSDYITDDYCWLDTDSLTATIFFLVPFGVVLLCNIVIYILALRNISRMGKDGQHLRASILFFVLLGLPWIALFLFKVHDHKAVQYFVSAVFALQGLCLLMFHLGRESTLRKTALDILCSRTSSTGYPVSSGLPKYIDGQAHLGMESRTGTGRSLIHRDSGSGVASKYLPGPTYSTVASGAGSGFVNTINCEYEVPVGPSKEPRESLYGIPLSDSEYSECHGDDAAYGSLRRFQIGSSLRDVCKARAAAARASGSSMANGRRGPGGSKLRKSEAAASMGAAANSTSTPSPLGRGKTTQSTRRKFRRKRSSIVHVAGMVDLEWDGSAPGSGFDNLDANAAGPASLQHSVAERSQPVQRYNPLMMTSLGEEEEVSAFDQLRAMSASPNGYLDDEYTQIADEECVVPEYLTLEASHRNTPPPHMGIQPVGVEEAAAGQRGESTSSVSSSPPPAPPPPMPAGPSALPRIAQLVQSERQVRRGSTSSTSSVDSTASTASNASSATVYSEAFCY